MTPENALQLEFLANKTFRCERHEARITEDFCRRYQVENISRACYRCPRNVSPENIVNDQGPPGQR